jgi:hypothetical protein
METLIYFYLWEKMDIIKKKFKFQKWKLPKCEIDDFQRDAFFGRNRRREEKETDIQELEHREKQLQEPSKEGKKGAGSEGGSEGGTWRGGGRKEGRRRKSGREECLQERHW